MQKLQSFVISICSGLILWAAWPTSSLTCLLFFGFVPLLFVADTVTKRNTFFLHCFIALLIWNATTTWWIWNSTDVGSIAAIIANSLLMCIPWWGYHVFKSKFSKRVSYFSLVACWMLFEYIHLNWQISWPWLSLGNAFAQQTQWIQWYEYTGVGGGTLWVLIVNILVYELIKRFKIEKVKWRIKKTLFITLLIFIPIAISILSFLQGAKQQLKNDNVIIVQPNIDPYQKFESSSVAQQLEKLIELSENKIDSNTKLVIWPETALAANVGVDEIAVANVYKLVLNFVNKYPKITLLTGIETHKILGTEKTTSSARKATQEFYYDSYNAAITFNANENFQLYIKSKLVPGVETLPSFLNILAPIFENFGGTTGGYAKDTAAKVFINAGNPFISAPVICSESIYGEYVASYVQKGANLITIITNDGWWGNTQGHKQHLAYAKLRAIETRRWVARSANTGISAVINDFGDIVETKAWNTTDAIKYYIPIKSRITFYVKYGDYLYKIFSAFALMLIVWSLVLWVKARIAKNQK